MRYEKRVSFLGLLLFCSAIILFIVSSADTSSRKEQATEEIGAKPLPSDNFVTALPSRTPTALATVSVSTSRGITAPSAGLNLAKNLPGSNAGDAITRVNIDSKQLRQSIAGLGGNYAKGRFDGQAEISDAVGRYNLSKLKPHYVRIGLPLKAWEPVNDDDAPVHLNWVKFQDNGLLHNIFLLMQDLKARGIQITASIWDVPDWLVLNPGSKEQRKINNYSELIETIATFLIRARDTYGVTIDYLSFNEANYGANIYFSALEYVNFIKQAGPQLTKLGLMAKWLVGDTNNAAALVNYARPILQEVAIQAYLGPIAFHSWDSNLSDVVLSEIANLSTEYDKPVWCTELGYDADLWRNNPAAFSSWDNAWKLAKLYHRILSLSRAEVIYYWEYEEDYPLISNSLAPYPAYFVVKQLVDNLMVGTQLVEVSSANPAIWALAAKSQNHFMVYLINISNQTQSVTIRGLPDITFNLRTTNSTEDFKLVGNYNILNGTLKFELGSQSLSFLTTLKTS